LIPQSAAVAREPPPLRAFPPENATIEAMEKVVQIFHSAQAADEADVREDARMLPSERIQIVIELRNRLYPDAAQQRLARVCRITQLEQS
jgi:hypothetical protein